MYVFSIIIEYISVISSVIIILNKLYLYLHR